MEHTPVNRIDWRQASSTDFIGESYLATLREAGEGKAAVLSVRFSPGARNAWHRHPEGQVLYVLDGSGLVVTREGDVVRVSAGDVVYAPPGEVHWHGANPHASMTHLSITTGGPTEWLGEEVTDEEYHRAAG